MVLGLQCTSTVLVVYDFILITITLQLIRHTPPFPWPTDGCWEGSLKFTTDSPTHKAPLMVSQTPPILVHDDLISLFYKGAG